MNNHLIVIRIKMYCNSEHNCNVNYLSYDYSVYPSPTAHETNFIIFYLKPHYILP